jgi:hypothetical protein
MFYARNFSLFVFPLLTGYFVWKRRLSMRAWVWLALAFAAAVVFANVYPFKTGSDTEALSALHLPLALWLPVGIAYAGGRWGESTGRMETRRGIDIEREALIVFDLLLVLVLGLLLYSIYARDPAALGENVLLLGNLGWSTVLYVRFLRGRGTFGSLERWQTAYLPAYSVWAAIVVVGFPPVFGFD